MISTAISGFALGFSLILAIGAQNAFVLRQGLLRQHVFALCLTCALSDAILIATGVAGFGALAQQVPWLEGVMRFGGATFLIFYGLRNMISAVRGGTSMPDETGTDSLSKVLLTCLTLTWLNPHVYLDTVVLLGSVSSRYENMYAFAFGAMSASFVFFFALGYGARILDPLFRKPRSWQIFDVIIGLIMWAIAAKLIFY